MTQNTELNDNMMLKNLDTLKEKRDQALLRIQNYQHLEARYNNMKVKNRYFNEVNLVLRKVYKNTVE